MNLSEEAREFLSRNSIKSYTIDPDGTINVSESVIIHTIQSKLPIKFGKINGKFNCNNTELISLEGAPSHVDGYFYCSYNQLTSLKGAPSYVGGSFSCQSNHLTSLEYAPGYISGNFSCNNNRLTSLHDIHKHIKEVNGWCYFHKDNIKDSVLGLLLIKGIREITIDNRDVEMILNKHFYKGRAGIFDAQQELLDAGLDEYARL